MDLFILVWIASAVIAAAIGSKKDEAGMGFLVGLIFGPLGIVFALLSKGSRVECRFCREPISAKASVCPHCRSPLGGSSTPAPLE